MQNWAGNVEYQAQEVRYPRSVDELQTVVARSRQVRALGTRHSFSRVGDTTGTLVSTRGLPAGLAVDADARVVNVPAGATYAELGSGLYDQGWALHNIGSLPHISVAGACATATHGSGVANGCLATAAVAVELVRGDGELVRSVEGDSDFPGMVLSLGSLGVITSLTLRIEPAFAIEQTVLLDVPTSAVLEDIDAVMSAAYSVSLFLSFEDPTRVDSVWLKARGTDGASGMERTWGGTVAPVAVHPIRGLDASAATDQLGIPGPSHLRLPHFRPEFTPSVGDELQSEFFIDRQHLATALERIQETSAALSPALQVMEIRTIARDDMWLSPFHGRDSAAIHATWVSDLEIVKPALRRLEELLAPLDPRPHWAKVFLGFDSSRLAGAYPAMSRFRDLALRLDPQRRFSNDYVESLGVR